MSCAMLGCKSHSGRHRNTPYLLSFHKFPMDEQMKTEWIKRTGRQNWTPKWHHRVCSRHFTLDSFDGNARMKRRRLKGDAIPVMHLDEYDDIEFVSMEEPDTDAPTHDTQPQVIEQPIKMEEADVRACRVCLSTDSRLYDIRETEMEDDFMKVTGYSASDGLPSHLCYLCRAELSKCASFRAKSERAHELLKALEELQLLNASYISFIDRHANNLPSNLKQTNVHHLDLNEHIPQNIQNNLKNPHENICPKVVTNIKVNEGKITIDGSSDLKNADRINNDHSDDLDDDTDEEIEDDDDIIEQIEMLDSDDSCDDDLGLTTDVVAEENADVTAIQKDHDYITENQINRDASELSNDYRDFSDSKVTSNALVNLGKKLDVKAKRRNKTGKSNRRRINLDLDAFEKEYDVKMRVLTEEEQRREIAWLKTTEEYLQKTYRCELCAKGYYLEEAFKDHMKRHDPKVSEFECQICHVRLSSEQDLKSHLRRHRVIYTCNSCGQRMRGTRTLVKLHRDTHTDNDYKCLHCDKRYRMRMSRDCHMRVCHPEKNIPCEECGETFLSLKGVQAHARKVHTPKTKLQTELECPTCHVRFSDTQALERHTRTAPDAAHACEPCVLCGENLPTRDALAAHAARCLRSDQLHCAECDKTFANAASYDTHYRRKHLKQRPRRLKKRMQPWYVSQNPAGWVCDVCGKLLRSQFSLTAHLRVHRGIRPFICDQCPKKYPTKEALVAHSRRHSGAAPRAPAQCATCGRLFSSRYTLEKHVNAEHLGVLYPCPECDKVFRRPDGRIQHINYVHKKIRRKKTSKATILIDSSN